jgi:ribosomal protein L22
MSVNSYPDSLAKAKIVHMILNKKTEEALQILSRFYNRSPPEIVVGTIKGKRRSVYAVYVQKESTIYTINSDIFYNPFVVLHEFYHHVRTREGVHRGSEKHANMYAKSFIDAYMKMASKRAEDVVKNQSSDSEWIMNNGL